MVRFEWDEIKNKTNRKKHGVWFEEAQQVFNDPNIRFFADGAHSDHKEDRYVVIGYSSETRLLVVVHCYRGADERVRIISARRATKKERLLYEERI